MKESVRLWLERAQYDLESASTMLESGRFLYVAFMCQQAIEKLLKGLIHNKTGKLPPYTHNLAALTKTFAMKLSEEQLDFLALLTRYYLNTRYPDYKQKLSQNLNREKAEELFRKTGEMYQCLKNALKI